jgi:hypothetical protein
MAKMKLINNKKYINSNSLFFLLAITIASAKFREFK